MPFHDFTNDPDKDPQGPQNPATQPTQSTTPAAISVPSAPTHTPTHIPAPPTQNNDAEHPFDNLNDKHKDSEPALFRDDVIDQTLAVLISKNKPNALLVGPAGSGKSRIAEDIARRLANDDVSIPDQLRGFTVLDVPVAELTAGAVMVGQLEARIMGLVQLATDPANKIIIFIDEIHQITGDQGQGSGTNQKIAQILKPHLARGDMRVIGATTTQEAKDFDHDPALKRRFSRINVSEFDREQTITILDKSRDSYTAHYGSTATVSDAVLDYVYTYSQNYNTTKVSQPDAALTLLDKSLATLSLDAQRLVNSHIVAATQKFPLTKDHVHRTAQELAHGSQPPKPVQATEVREQLRVIINQDHIIEPVITTLDREKLNIFPRTKPLSWLFAGSSGVGKTEVARIMSRAINGCEPIIINGPEYRSEHSTAKIIGSPAGYIGSNSKRAMPFDALKNNPRQVIVLDELEKAHNALQQLFMSALDAGTMEMADGTVLDFSQCIIIATTNAARDKIGRDSFGFGMGAAKHNSAKVAGKNSNGAAATGVDLEALDPRAQEKLKKLLAQEFPVELLNRFHDVFAFNRIDADDYRIILSELYQRRRDLVITNHPHYAADIPVDIDDAVLDQLVNTTFVSDFGARPAARTIENYIASLLM